jgi:hypothetical protein
MPALQSEPDPTREELLPQTQFEFAVRGSPFTGVRELAIIAEMDKSYWIAGSEGRAETVHDKTNKSVNGTTYG